MKVYKVVSRAVSEDGRVLNRISASGRFDMDSNPDEWTLIYKQNEPTLPVIGKLFAFETEDAAHTFVRRCGGSEIWEAETSYAKPAKFVACATPDIELFWNNDTHGMTIPAPKGTMFCDDITLTKKLWDRWSQLKEEQ